MSPRKPLSPQEKVAWIRLSRTSQIGPITFKQLLSRFGSAQAALDALPELSRKGGRSKPLSPFSKNLAEEELTKTEGLGGSILFSCEPDFPDLLAQIEDCPPSITVLGHPSLLNRNQIGVVGARNASVNGRKMAERLSKGLGEHGYGITSGLARGVDASAHQAALATGTIAVVAGGVDVIYPEENTRLYHQIKETGCIVAEQPLGCQPQATLFPRRNRLISGLSLGVIVVEAAVRSGSLITAHMALEQGRDVFAVPGSPLDPRANGTNALIRQGAILTETPEDVLGHIKTQNRSLRETGSQTYEGPQAVIDEHECDLAREKILENLSPSPISVDELARQCQLSLPLVLTALLELELAGRIERQPGHQVALIG